MLPVVELIRDFVNRHPILIGIKDTKPAKFVKSYLNQQYLDGRRKQVQKYGYEIVEFMYKIALQMNVDIWIDWGTFLGYYREGKILEHDYDLDFSTWKKDKVFHQKLKKNILENRAQLVREFCYNGEVVTETYCYKNILFDVEYYETDGKQIWTYSFDLAKETVLVQTRKKQIIKGMNLYIFYTDSLDFKEGTFTNGVKCCVPLDAEKRVIELYGKDWHLPVKEYCWQDLKNYKFCGFQSKVTGWRLK